MQVRAGMSQEKFNWMKKEIVLIGGGGHCKSVIDVIEKEVNKNITKINDDEEL